MCQNGVDFCRDPCDQLRDLVVTGGSFGGKGKGKGKGDSDVGGSFGGKGGKGKGKGGGITVIPDFLANCPDVDPTLFLSFGGKGGKGGKGATLTAPHLTHHSTHLHAAF